MKISFTTNVRTNARKFSSIDELPPDIREAYERALANGPGKLTVTGPKVVTRLVVNGKEVESTNEMSEAEQKLVSDVMQLLKTSGAPANATTAPAQSATIAAPVPAPVESGWLTKKQWQLIMVATALVALALTLVLARG